MVGLPHFNRLINFKAFYNIILAFTALVAQLVERIHGKDEVSGSIPLESSSACLLKDRSMV